MANPTGCTFTGCFASLPSLSAHPLYHLGCILTLFTTVRSSRLQTKSGFRCSQWSCSNRLLNHKKRWECHRQVLALSRRAATHPSTTHGRTRWGFPPPFLFLIQWRWFTETTLRQSLQPVVLIAPYQTTPSSSGCTWTACTAASTPPHLLASAPRVSSTCIPRTRTMTREIHIHTTNKNGETSRTRQVTMHCRTPETTPDILPKSKLTWCQIPRTWLWPTSLMTTPQMTLRRRLRASSGISLMALC